MQFKKNPVVIEADQWFPGGNIPGVIELPGRAMGYIEPQLSAYGCRIIVAAGDWVIHNADGTKKVIRPEDFERQYERVS